MLTLVRFFTLLHIDIFKSKPWKYKLDDVVSTTGWKTIQRIIISGSQSNWRDLSNWALQEPVFNLI